eukprot:SAG11_NODE_3508_length_2406_cov_1.835284_1_plen_310_part_00
MHTEQPEQDGLRCGALETKGLHEDHDVGLGQPLVKHGIARLTSDAGGVELLINCDGEINGQCASARLLESIARALHGWSGWPCIYSAERAVWGAGAALALYFFEGPGKGLIESYDRWPEVVEVGSGTGLVGMAAAVAGAGSVVLTDLPAGVARLTEAIEANTKNGAFEPSGVVIEAKALPWGDSAAALEVAPDGCDLVLGADLCCEATTAGLQCYAFCAAAVIEICWAVFVADNPDLFDDLCTTLHDLAEARNARVLVATEQRWENVNERWAAAVERSKLEVVLEETLPAHPRLSRTVLLQQLRVVRRS